MQTSILKYRRAIVAKIAFSVVAILSAAQIQAVPIIGNSNPGPLSPEVIIASRPRAAGFTMPGQDYTLTDVVLRLESYSGPSDAIVSIYSDSSGFPGISLATLIDPATAGSSPADYTFLPPAGPPTTLLANTSYWLVLDTETGGSYLWNSATDAPGGVANFDGYAQNNGVSWAVFVPAGLNLRFTINGEPVTPSVPDTGNTVMLLGITLLSLAFVSGRQWTCCSKR